jgi:very-short-patch-repair endonuclease
MDKKEILQQRAKHLRKTSTDAENYLWHHIRGRRLGKYKFKRQRPIGNYIVDFICLWKKLIIELDGGQHADMLDYDQKRTAFLEEKGYRVIRFWNTDVLIGIESVLDVIWNELSNR